MIVIIEIIIERIFSVNRIKLRNCVFRFSVRDNISTFFFRYPNPLASLYHTPGKSLTSDRTKVRSHASESMFTVHLL